ncbi:alpha/beta hydrolase [Methylobacterium sp. WL69]|uniref:alpha/beta fold hydrolase n=1 Tax=Methylobacterium sp. WL69 TaxID=2603893 RepID=UPI001AEEA0D1|nr:alpha/beta hydrolase [Methylobacterium sp. WL69]
MTTALPTAFALGAVVLAALLSFAFVVTWLIARGIARRLPPRGYFLDLPQGRIHYLEAGSGRPLVFVHGLGGQLGNFAYALLDRLSDRFRVVLIDRPGSGHSPRSWRAPADLPGQADTILGVIRHLGLERPIVVGHSLGGAVALALGLEHPRLIGGLALIAPLTQPQDTVPAPFRLLAIRSSLLRMAVAWTLATPLAILRSRGVLDTVFGPDAVPADFGTRGGGLLGLRPSSFYAASMDLNAAGADMPGLAARYPGLAVPVAVLYGTGDRVLSSVEHGEGLKRVLPGTRLDLVPGGHMLPVTDPDRVAAWITAIAAGMTPEESKPHTASPSATGSP